MVQNVLETNLAWALIEAAKPHLSRSERHAIFVVVGAGDTFGTIRRLFDCIASKQILLRADLVVRCGSMHTLVTRSSSTFAACSPDS